MLLPTAVTLLVICELCAAIRVPASWDSWDEGDSEVKPSATQEFAAETFNPQNNPTKPVPVEYFEYTAKKPQFAVDIASFHGVQSPENHYSAYPIKPHTGKVRPELGKHKIINSENTVHKPLQDFANLNENNDKVAPVSSSYEVFHPYEAEVPALQELYKDPVLNKIRGDLENSKSRLQQYEKDAGESDINKEEYLENPHKTGNRLVPHRNVPAPYEVHRPQRRPVYYRQRPRYNPRDKYLNHRLRHPWNQHIKVRPAHYQPLKSHIHHLRQNHALKYDDERNEYPQVQILENISDPKDGYDIYEKGKEKYARLRDNVDESINKAVIENRPTKYQKLEMQPNDSSDNEEDDENEFVPIKNYAQVRKTETFRHLPRAAALREAETLDEIRNAPRLREAVKSTKAQTVYTEEGYEDAAYDHAGEQKHASENEGHGGFLKQQELSGGKFKTPSVSGSFDDGHGSVYRDKLVHGKKWKDDNKDVEKEKEEESYSEDEHEQLLEATNHQKEEIPDENSSRNKRENSNQTVIEKAPDNSTDEKSLQHQLNNRVANFEVPQIDYSSTFLTEEDILKIAKLKAIPKRDNIKEKYPYYFRNLKRISEHSPLRYAENLKLIPKKSKGGTEFYDSRSGFECPEVDDVPDPVPEKLKNGSNPENEEEEEEGSGKGEENFDAVKKQPRLKGLGDKIDCFKAKYFGENPLDSPFFKEDLISNPQPVTLPNLTSYKLGTLFKDGTKGELKPAESQSHNVFSQPYNHGNISDLYSLIEKLRTDKNDTDNEFYKNIENFGFAFKNPKLNETQEIPKPNVYSDIIEKIKNNNLGFKLLDTTTEITDTLLNQELFKNKNITYTSFQNKEDITKLPTVLRKKRATPFTYEPYKIIRDSQVQDSKKTTTTSNISPLIKQLQSSRIVDKVKKSSSEPEPVKYVNTKTYKDIGKSDRTPTGSKNDKPEETAIVDVSVDSRRGEPRYEVRHPNHKSTYTPVENRKAMSVEDYKSHTNNTEKYVPQRSSKQRKPYFDVSKYLPPLPEVQNVEASNTVRKTVSSTTLAPKKEMDRSSEGENDEDYDYYEDEEDDVTTTTTTTTPKPSFRRRVRPTTTTEETPTESEPTRLRLVTRFRDYKPDNFKSAKTEEETEKPSVKKQEIIHDEIEPKYREKKKKLTKSTLVTDTKKYGGDDDDEDDDMEKEEVDAMIGIKGDMDDYMPSYEKERLSKNSNKEKERKQHNSDDDEQESDESDNEDDDEEEDDDDDDENDEDEDEDTTEEDDDEEEEEDDTETEGNAANEQSNEKKNHHRSSATSPEPPPRTLAVTTDAPTPISPGRLPNLQEKPLVTRTKFEIHKDLPLNKSSPHTSQYKQDIKEIEIIKEVPRRKRPNKNVETLELYKDENLPKEINKLSDVEVFKENLNLHAGPKHGGNYRRLPSTTAKPVAVTTSKGDAEASQSEYKKEIRTDGPQKIRINLRGRDDQNNKKSAKLIELVEPTQTSMHGGNLRYNKGRTRNNNSKSEKLIELQDDDDNEDSSDDSGEENRYSSRRGRPMHGGNYRSANLMVEKETNKPETSKTAQAKEARRKSARLLSSFAQAAPVLTTTPRYILDPSKRMYYYVDT